MTREPRPHARRIRWMLICGAIAAALVDASLRPGAPAFDRDDDEPGFDSPDQAMEWVLLAQRDERGNIPRDGLMKARAQVDAMRRATRDPIRSGGSAAPAVAGVSRGAWTWIGPTNVGGRVRAIAIDPTAPSTLIAGGVAGGIWKSTNGGAGWRVIDDFMANLAVTSIVFRPGEHVRLFAGTGEGFFNADSIRGAGVFMSGDQGETWTQLPSTANVNFDFVNRLAFSADGNTLLAATRTGLFRSTDLGASWSQVLNQANMLDVKFAPGSSQVVASGRNRNAYYSSNAGQSWTAAGGLVLTSTAIRVELAVSQSAPNVVYASVDENSGQIWRSADSGASYTLVSSPAHLSTQGWYDNALWVDPTDSNHLVAGGVSLFRSVNGGTSFSGISSCHVDQHIILHDPGYNGSSNRRVYFGSDGGVCKMEDVTVNLVTSLRNGLGITQFYAAGGSAIAGRVMGGTQDNGTQLYDLATDTAVWSTQFGSDGGFSAIDPANGNYLYGETQNFRIHRSLTGGTPSQYIYGGTGAQSCTKPEPYQITDACNGNANFIAPFMLDPNEPNRMLAGGRSLWRSNDVRTPNTASTGPMWSAIKGPATGNSNISAIAVADGNPDIVWVGHNNGEIYVSLNGTSTAPTWVRTDGTLPNRVITSIAIHRADPRIVFVSMGGFSPDSLWRTTNGGATWQDLTGTGGSGLPDVPVRWVVQHPVILDWLYAATDVGVFASADGGESWNLPHDGPSNVAVFQLFWLDQTLVAVTHGRGLYTAVAASQFPAFSHRPHSQGILPGHAVAFNVEAVGASPITYQWFRGQSGDTSSPIPGATSGSFTTPPITETTSYWIRATNPFGVTDSNTATLTLLAWGTILPGVSKQGNTNTADAGTRSSSSTPRSASVPATAASPAGQPATGAGARASTRPLVGFMSSATTADAIAARPARTSVGSAGSSSVLPAPGRVAATLGSFVAASESVAYPLASRTDAGANPALAVTDQAPSSGAEVPFTSAWRPVPAPAGICGEGPGAPDFGQLLMNSSGRVYRSPRSSVSARAASEFAAATVSATTKSVAFGTADRSDTGAPTSQLPAALLVIGLAVPALLTRAIVLRGARRR